MSADKASARLICKACEDVGRKSLAQEIRETLLVLGFWAPSPESAASDLITAVGDALLKSVNERDALLARVAELEGAVRTLLDGDEPWDQRATAARAALGQEEYPTAQDRP